MRYYKFTILLIFGLAISLSVSGCLKKPVTNQNQNANANVVADEIDTSDWKTYRNEEYGFEVKYPDYLIYYNKQIKSNDGKYVYKYDPAKSEQVTFTHEKYLNVGVGAANINISVKEDVKILDNYINENFRNCTAVIKKEIAGYTYSYFSCDDYAEPQFYLIESKGIIYIFSANGALTAEIENMLKTVVFF